MRAHAKDAISRAIFDLLAEDDESAAVALLAWLNRQTPALRAWLWEEFARSPKTRAEFRRLVESHNGKADSLALAHTSGEDRARAVETARLMRGWRGEVDGRPYGGLSRPEIERWIRRYGRFSAGDFCEITGADERGVELVKDGKSSRLSYRYTDRITVAAASELEIGVGDRLQLKFNGSSIEGAPLSNGELVTVRSVRRNGTLLVEDESGTHKTLAASQRLFNRGYAVTSYASQGKTVDTVLFADAANRAATNRNQWYVAISRGRKRVVVFTTDKDELRANIRRLGERELALELKTSASVPGDESRQRVRRLPAWTRRAWQIIRNVQRRRFIAQHQASARESQQIRVRLREAAGEGDGRIGESMSELGFAYLRQGRVWKGCDLMRVGVEKLAGEDSGFLVRAHKKLAWGYALTGHPLKAWEEREKAKQLARKNGMFDQL